MDLVGLFEREGFFERNIMWSVREGKWREGRRGDNSLCWVKLFIIRGLRILFMVRVKW